MQTELACPRASRRILYASLIPGDSQGLHLPQLGRRLTGSQPTEYAVWVAKVEALGGGGQAGGASDLEIFRRMADMSSDGFFLTDVQGHFLYVNARGCELSGYSAAELEHMSVPDIALNFPPERFKEMAERLAREPVAPFESLNRRADGTTYHVEVSVARIDTESGAYLFGVVRDITARKHTEALLRHFSRSVLSTLEAERRRVARELHDGVGQDLAVLGLELNTLRKAKGWLSSEAKGAIARLEANLKKTAESVASLVREYHPAELSDLGVSCAIAAFAQRFGKSRGLEVKVAVDSIDGLLSEEQELHLYRIVQEALNNVAKHAHATRVEIEIANRGAEVVAAIRDDGRGFEPVAPRLVRSGGVGLTTMRERAQIVGGSLRIESRTGGGTNVILTIPMVGHTP